MMFDCVYDFLVVVGCGLLFRTSMCSLDRAAAENHLEACRVLLDAGADINATDPSGENC
jgi:hypothetical protein